MSLYKVPVSFRVNDTLMIEADSAAEAFAIAREALDESIPSIEELVSDILIEYDSIPEIDRVIVEEAEAD